MKSWSCLLLAGVVGCAPVTQFGAKQDVDSLQLLQQSFDQEELNPEAACEASDQALRIIDRTVRRFPGSELAAKIRKDQTLIQDLKLADIRQRQTEMHKAVLRCGAPSHRPASLPCGLPNRT